ncbi:MAG: hypothetical protein DMH00_05635 [Acidobacteria bacterium]|nr:MAG: hypothetical protein DMH00_05635 [Acidobacteriota bacterium]
MSRPKTPNLSDSQIAGQLLVVGIDGTVLDAELGRRLQTVCPGGIILFARNLVTAPQVAALCRDLSTALPLPPFLAIDQEGGRVNRLKGIFPSIPANLSLAQSPAAEDLVRDHANQTGTGLRLLGFNLNFAPVLDLSEENSPNGIGDRAYGSDPGRVAHLARIFLGAQDAAGVLGCGKHFPGLGGGTVDSHRELPVIPRSAEGLWNGDLLPYRELWDMRITRPCRERRRTRRPSPAPWCGSCSGSASATGASYLPMTWRWERWIRRGVQEKWCWRPWRPAMIW